MEYDAPLSHSCKHAWSKMGAGRTSSILSEGGTRALCTSVSSADERRLLVTTYCVSSVGDTPRCYMKALYMKIFISYSLITPTLLLRKPMSFMTSVARSSMGPLKIIFKRRVFGNLIEFIKSVISVCPKTKNHLHFLRFLYN